MQKRYGLAIIMMLENLHRSMGYVIRVDEPQHHRMTLTLCLWFSETIPRSVTEMLIVFRIKRLLSVCRLPSVQSEGIYCWFL